MSELTERQQAVFDFIRETISEKCCPPSVREIGDHFGITSPNGVMCHLKALQAKRRITRDPFNARSIRLVGYRMELTKLDQGDCEKPEVELSETRS